MEQNDLTKDLETPAEPKESEVERQQMEGSTPASELVREGWDSLPGTEQSVDYPPPLQPPWVTLTPTADAVVEIVVRTPDGLRITVEEALEYELDDDGVPKDFDFGDIQSLWLKATSTMDARLNR